MSDLVPSAVAAFLVALVLTPVVRNLGHRWNHLDLPNARSSHQAPTPRNGGLAIVAGILVGVWSAADRWTFALLAAAALLVVLALLDDARPLPHWLRFVVQLAACGGFLAASGHPVSVPALGAVGAAVVLLWLVWMVNAYNFMDGINGIAALEAVVCGLTFATLGALVGDPVVTVVALAVAGAAAGFFPWNAFGGSIFMGDVGSVTLGLLLAAVAARLVAAGLGAAPLLPLLPFLLDAGVTLLRRVVRRERFWEAHRSHYYQRLVQSGWSHLAVTSLVGGLAAAGGAAAIAYPSASPQARVTLGALVLLLHVVVGLAIDLTHARRAVGDGARN